MSTSTSLNLSTESSAAPGNTATVVSRESRSASSTPRGRGRARPPSASARVGSARSVSARPLVKSTIKPKRIKDIFPAMASQDPSALPFSAGELPDQQMSILPVSQTPDHPSPAWMNDPNGPRIELHRHESYNQLNPTVELHHHEHNQQLNQVYVAPQIDPQLMAEAAGAVAHARTEAVETVAGIRTEAQAYVSSVERDATQAVEAARTKVAEVQNEAMIRVLQVEHSRDETVRKVKEDCQRQATEMIADIERRATDRLRKQQEEFDDEKSKLLHKLSVAKGTVVESHHDTGNEDLLSMLSELDSQVKSLCQRQLDFEIHSKALWDEMKSNLENLSDRVSSLEGWYEDDQEVVKLVSPDGSPIRVQETPKTPKVKLFPGGSPPGSPHHSSDDDDEGNGNWNRRNGPDPNGGSNRSDQDKQGLSLEDQCLKWKDVSGVRLPSLPESAGALRSWKNTVIPIFIALDKSPENHLSEWLMFAFRARTPAELKTLSTNSQGFPRLDRMLCSWLSKPDCLKGYFGPRIQAYLEETMLSGIGLRGRYILNMVIREFDLDSALGGIISSVELFQLPSPDNDNISSLIHFRDKIQFILGQLPISEKPSEDILSKWLFERLRKVKCLHLVIDRIKESGVGAVERTFDYLWNRVQKAIAESQHERNLTSIQENLRKGPVTRKPGAVAQEDPKGKGKGKKGGDKGKGKGKGKGKESDKKGKKGNGKTNDAAKGGKTKTGDKGNKNNGESASGSGDASTKEGVCIFWPKGLCRRGDECPYKHEGQAPKAKAAPAVKPPKAAVALVGAAVLGVAASSAVQPTADRFELEWALDSGAGEHLASEGALAKQGVPRSVIADYATVSASPMVFDTGGGHKDSSMTVGVTSDEYGDGLVYMLKSCPFVKSLGKLVEAGFSFVWGPKHQPTLIPCGQPFEASYDYCITADRVEHHVPIFREDVLFTRGMPAPRADPVVHGTVHTEEAEVAKESDEPLAEVFEDAKDKDGQPDRVAPGSSHDRSGEGEVRDDSPKAPHVEIPKVSRSSMSPKIPVDHLLTHQPALPHCDVCRQAKLRSHAHRRFPNQSERKQDAQVVEAPRAFLQRVACDHLEAREEGLRGEKYSLVCVDVFSGVIYAYASADKTQASVEHGLRHFCRESKPIVASDRAPSILAAIESLGMHSDPSPPGDKFHNPYAESAIKTIRQGTRSLLLQSGLPIEFWTKAQACFAAQFNLSSMPSLEPGSLRQKVQQEIHKEPDVQDPGGESQERDVEDHELPGLNEPIDEGEGEKDEPQGEKDEPQWQNKLHLALGYVSEGHLIPFGALVWYRRTERGTFEPNGVPALYLGPEILPAMRFKDTHVLLDLESWREDRIREIVTKDFTFPSGKWVFPLTKVQMLQSPMPDSPQIQGPAVDRPIARIRNRVITNRRILQYGETDMCDGCLLGTYAHSYECRERFNRLLDELEPLPPSGIEGDADDGDNGPKPDEGLGQIFRGDVFEDDEGDVPECPPPSDDDDEYSPSPSGEAGVARGLASLAEYVVESPGSSKKKGIGWFIEFCCEEESACCRVARHFGIPYLGITRKSLDIDDPVQFEQLLVWVQDAIQNDEGPIHLWGSLPCTKWSMWQEMAKHKDPEYHIKLEEERGMSLLQVHRYKDLADVVSCSRGGSNNFEWPKGSQGWKEPTLIQMIECLGMESVDIDGCAFDLEIDGKRPLKPWTIKTTSKRLAQNLAPRKCSHPKGYVHDHVEGSLTVKTGVYNIKMATCILASLFPSVVFSVVPGMPVVPFVPHPHVEHDPAFDSSPNAIWALIHKLLSRDEMRKDPLAIQAIKDEGLGIRARDVWDDKTVMEKDERLKLARAKGELIHVASVMAIASIKFWESPQKRKYKARVVFRGDAVKDSYGAAARFGELYSTPTNLQSINTAIYYGLMQGHCLRAADCTKAYLQAMLLTEEDTYIILPPELWLDSWKGRYRQPTVKLNKALYGHPLASVFWDLHLRQVLLGDLGLEAVDGHPSVFICSQTKLLVVVYVDDILVAGPEKQQGIFWKRLRSKLELDEVEDLSQFIGRYHHVEGNSCVFNMSDYAQQALELYQEVCGEVKYKHVSTPYVSDALLTDEDYDSVGQVGDKAASVLMKLLWLTRLSRPDLAFAVSQLSTQVTRWCRNSDKMLYRLMCYLSSTRTLCMKVSVLDSPSSCTLDLYVDADLGGCPFTSKSTSGMFLVIRGPGGTFCPIVWGSRRQQHVARSTADAELNALSEGVFEELLPTYQLLQKLLDTPPSPVAHEDNAAVTQAVKKGYSVKLRHLARTPRLALSSLHECLQWMSLVQEPTNSQLADIMTKALSPKKFDPQSVGLRVWRGT